MRTLAPVPISTRVAVEAQDLEAGREAVPTEPEIQVATTPDATPMLVASTVDVIQGKEAGGSLTTTGTLRRGPPIRNEYLTLPLGPVRLLPTEVELRVAVPPCPLPSVGLTPPGFGVTRPALPISGSGTDSTHSVEPITSGPITGERRQGLVGLALTASLHTQTLHATSDITFPAWQKVRVKSYQDLHDLRHATSPWQ